MTDPSRPRPRSIISLLALLARTKLQGSRALALLDHPRTRRLGRGLGGLSLLLTSTWLVANLTPREVPDPLWTEQDRASVEAERNGWSAQIIGKIVDIPGELREVLERGALGGQAEALHEFLASPDAERALAYLERARARPEFALYCELDGPCNLLSWKSVHDVGTLQVLALADRGRTPEALALLGDLVRLDVAAIESTNNMLGLFVSFANLDQALQLGSALVAAPGSADAASLAGLARAVASIETGPLDLRELVISDYLATTELVERAIDGGSDELPERLEPRGPRWLYSHGLTLAELNERFEARHAAAAEGDFGGAFGALEDSPTQAFGWWLTNPVGDLLLEEMLGDPEALAETFADQRASLARARADLLEALDSPG